MEKIIEKTPNKKTKSLLNSQLQEIIQNKNTIKSIQEELNSKSKEV